MNAISAIEYLKTHGNIHIIFLDINMPQLSGIQLLKILQPQQPVIFTTAYSEYAVESYDLNAADYLLKPFSFERFTIAVYKAIDILEKTSDKSSKTYREKKPVIFIKSDGKNYPVYVDDIVYCEAMKNYTMVVLKTGQKLMPLIPLSKFENLLGQSGGDFIQIHRSYLVSKRYITSVSANSVWVDKYDIPIGILFKERFFKAIGIGK
jgi:DNA-binding LytR/AlgR family response regulator